MIEPGVRYLPHVPLPSPIPQPMTLEAAVDLSKKAGEPWRPQSTDNIEAEDEDSDDGVPIDMSLTAGRLPVFPGLKRSVSPATSDRSDFLGRVPSGLYSPGSAPGRDWSERSEPDKGKAYFANRMPLHFQVKLQLQDLTKTAPYASSASCRIANNSCRL